MRVIARVKTAASIRCERFTENQGGIVKNYDLHLVCKIFPEASDTVIASLALDIQANGLHEPIVLLDGKVLDGRTRGRACMRAGVEPRFIDWEEEIKPTLQPGVGPTEWVISKNLHRRHLSASQCAAVSAEAVPLLKTEAKERQQAGGAAGRKSRYEEKEVPKEQPTPRQPAQRARDEAAAMTGASPRLTARAERIKAASLELHEQVKAGDVTVGEAERQVKAGDAESCGDPKCVGWVHRFIDGSMSADKEKKVIAKPCSKKPIEAESVPITDERREKVAKQFKPVGEGVVRLAKQLERLGLTQGVDDVYRLEVLEAARAGLEDPQVWRVQLDVVADVLTKLRAVARKAFK